MNYLPVIVYFTFTVNTFLTPLQVTVILAVPFFFPFTTPLELTGNQNKLDAFLNLMADFEVLEMVRTGITGLGRGVSTLN